MFYSNIFSFMDYIFSVNTETIAYMITYGLSAAARLVGWITSTNLFLFFLALPFLYSVTDIEKHRTYYYSTRVSNELGAGNPNRAKSAMAVTLKLSVLLALIVVLALGFGHNIWAGFFSDSHEIIQEFASMTPLLTISIIADSVQGVLSGKNPQLFFFYQRISPQLLMLMILILQGWLEDVVCSTWLCMLTWQPSIALVYQLQSSLVLHWN